MKAITATLITLFLLMLVGPAQATYVSQSKLDDLYQVFNTLFYETESADRLSSDIELLNSAYFLPNGEDLQFGDPGDTLRIDLTYRDASFGNELGYMSGESYSTLIDASHIENHQINQHGNTFTVPASDTCVI